MRLSVVGCGPAAPQADTPASGLLVESAETAVLFDCGYGVVGRLRAILDPRGLAGVVVGHLHADHLLDLAALRYLHPWPGTSTDRPAVWLPPGGIDHLTGLAGVMSERPTFFAEAFDLHEYASGTAFRIAGLEIRPDSTQHYVPAHAMTVRDATGTRLVYAGDGGPTDRLVEIARAADLLVEEATLASSAEDEAVRGHSTAAEAIDIARRAGARRLLLTHFPSVRRPDLQAIAERTRDIPVEVARTGLRLDVVRQTGTPAPSGGPGSDGEASSRSTLDRSSSAV